MRQVLLATTNPAKLARLRGIVEGLPCTVLIPEDMPRVIHPTVAEDAGSFRANAVQKARTWSRAAGGMLTLASDGGVVIPALGDRWNALHTRRNAGAAASNQDRVEHLLSLMRDLDGEQRRAFWQEAIAVAHADAGDECSEVTTWEAEGDGGLIVRDPPVQCDGPFWTEYIRYYPAIGKRYCDLTAREVDQLDQVWPRLRRAAQIYLRDQCR